MRQTELTFEELVSIFHSPKGCDLPLCLVVNEIGELAKEGDERAFQKLIEWLKAKDPGCRFAALGWLGECGNPTALKSIYELIKAETNAQIAEMAGNVKNRLEIILGWSARN